jgi:hypothetical protein
MTVTTTIRTLFAVVVGGTALASSALAAGEPKSQLPFTQPLGTERSATAAVGPKHISRSSISVATADAKFQIPFTALLGSRRTSNLELGREHASSTSVTSGDSKSQLPFTRS